MFIIRKGCVKRSKKTNKLKYWQDLINTQNTPKEN
mgnify:CR=1 FL=1